MSSYFNRDKPEGALKRAQDLMNVGNKPDALKLLHDVITAKRHHRQWQQTYENIMMMYLELCVDLKEHRGAKDGLHQYRNMSQQHGGDSLEKVILFYVDLAEKKVAEASERAKAVNLAAAAAKISDLENDVVLDPESIMLSTMTEDSDKERTDRDIMVPWLKFLWETYRAVLEVLKTLQKLEHVYHMTCEKALNFCKKYERNREFHSLCDTLSTHLASLQKAAMVGQSHKAKGWEHWTTESIEAHLKTRFTELEVADSLKLWNEGFRIVEDIYTLMQTPVRQSDGSYARKPLKRPLMAQYYEKLTKIFFVSENYLFHAYAWHKYYALIKESRNHSAEEKATAASITLISALIIPPITDALADPNLAGSDAFLNEDILKRRKKNEKIAALLDFNANPTRQLLLQDLVTNRGILNQVLPEVRDLYHKLEVEFAPLTLVSSLMPTIQFMRAGPPKLQPYVRLLERQLVLRLIKQLSTVYHTLKLDKLTKLIAGLDVSFYEVEQLVVQAVKDRQVKARIDHLNRCVRFGDAEMEGDSMRFQLITLARQLGTVNDVLAPQSEAEEERHRVDFFRKVVSNLEAQHMATLTRKDIIEKQKIDKEREKQRRNQLEMQKKVQEERIRRENEDRRMEEDRKRREEERKRKEEEEEELEKDRKALAKLGMLSKAEELEKLNAEARRKELEDLKAANIAAKEEEARKLKEQAKRLDYTVRALRLSERELIEEAYKKQLEEDEKDHLKREAEADDERRKIFEGELALKRRFAPMLQRKADFEALVVGVSHSLHERFVADLRSRHDKMWKGKLSRARQRKADEEERRARENRRQEEFRRHEEQRLAEARKAREAYEKEVEERARRLAEGNGAEDDDDYPDDDEIAPDDEYGPGYVPPQGAALNGHHAEDEPVPESPKEGPADKDAEVAGPSKPGSYVPPGRREGGMGSSWRDRQAAKEKEKEEAEAKRQALLQERHAADTPPPAPGSSSPRGGRRDVGGAGGDRGGSWRRGGDDRGGYREEGGRYPPEGPRGGGGFRDREGGGYRDREAGGRDGGYRERDGGYGGREQGGYGRGDRDGFRGGDRDGFRGGDRGGDRDGFRGGDRGGDRDGYRGGDRGGDRDGYRGGGGGGGDRWSRGGGDYGGRGGDRDDGPRRQNFGRGADRDDNWRRGPAPSSPAPEGEGGER